VSSNLACVGLAVADAPELGALIDRARAAARLAGTFDGVEVFRWHDPSGAGLILGLQGDEVADLLPVFASTSGCRIAGCHLINRSVASAEIVDDDGEQLTAMTFEAEQYRQLKAHGRPVTGAARITALGVSVAIHAGAEAFAASPSSLLSPGSDPPGPPPASYVERGWAWPPRLAAESFLSSGVFADPADSTAHAQLSGTILRASHRICELTGQGFSVAAVRTVGFDTDLCLADTEHPIPPEPGSILSGTVFLTATIGAAELPVASI
jgi:hypothetical protein